MPKICQWRNKNRSKFVRLFALAFAVGAIYVVVYSLSSIGIAPSKIRSLRILPSIKGQVQFIISPSVSPYTHHVSSHPTQEESITPEAHGDFKRFPKPVFSHKQIRSSHSNEKKMKGKDSYSISSGRDSSQENVPYVSPAKYEKPGELLQSGTALRSTDGGEPLNNEDISVNTDCNESGTLAYYESQTIKNTPVLRLKEKNQTANKVDTEISTQRNLNDSSDSIHQLNKDRKLGLKKYENNSQILKESSLPSKEMKLILIWTQLFSGWNILVDGKRTFSDSKCSETRCEVTNDRSRLKDSHVVVFHVRTMSLLDLPPNRLPHQKWVFFTLEAPPHSHFSGFAFMYEMFNWTMTYRSDSDIVIPYGRVGFTRQGKSSSAVEKEWYMKWKSKSRMAIWMASHCVTPSNREEYIHQLQNYMDVDILGFCGSAVCPYNKTEKCLESFAKRYKFLLAFENAICKDYVTEKFFRALNYNVVPVVLGGVDYKPLAPPNSYINALDFHSPKHLANYLYNVGMNFTLYKKFLIWKLEGYEVEDNPSFCPLCKKLHSSDFDLKTVYKDISQWWNYNSKCTKWKA